MQCRPGIQQQLLPRAASVQAAGALCMVGQCLACSRYQGLRSQGPAAAFSALQGSAGSLVPHVGSQVLRPKQGSWAAGTEGSVPLRICGGTEAADQQKHLKTVSSCDCVPCRAGSRLDGIKFIETTEQLNLLSCSFIVVYAITHMIRIENPIFQK